MRSLLLILLLTPIFGFSQIESKTNISNYTESEVKKFLSIKRESISVPISDEEVIDMVARSGMTLEEYGLLIKQSFASENHRLNTKPKNAKQIKLADLVHEKNLTRATTIEKQLGILCVKHGLPKIRYDEMVRDVETNMGLKTKVLEVLRSDQTPKK